MLVLSATIFLEPFSKLQGQKLFSMSNYYLAPLQGLVVGALSILFTTSEKGVPEAAKTQRGA